MPFDDLNDSPDYKKFLDEIKRRAEEAELARIEAEEIKLSSHLSMDAFIVASGRPHEASHRLENDFEVMEPVHTAPQHPEENENSFFLEAERATLSPVDDSYANYSIDLKVDEIESASAFDPSAEEVNIGYESPLPEAPAPRERETALDAPEVIAPSFPESPKEKVPNVQERSRRKHWKRAAIHTAIALCVVGALFAGYFLLGKELIPTTTRIVVLTDHTSTAESYVTEGLAEELITALSQVPSLHVVAPTSALAVRDAKSALQLKPDRMIRLKLDRRGEAFVINVVMTNVATSETQLQNNWTFTSHELSRVVAGLFPRITAALDIEAKLSRSGSPANAKAYNSYLLGWNALRHSESISLDSAEASFRRSCAEDASFVEAKTALGITLIRQYEASLSAPANKVKEAEEILLHVAGLGNQAAELQYLWGMLDDLKGDLDAALHHLSNSIDKAPSNAQMHGRLALASLRALKFEEAQRYAEAAVSLDPLNANTRLLLAVVLMLTEGQERAMEQFEVVVQDNPDLAVTVQDQYITALVSNNKQESALAILRARASNNPDDYIAQYDLGRMLQLAGKPKAQWDEALLRSQELVRTFIKSDTMNATAQAYRGLVATRLGNFEEGIASAQGALNKAPQDVAIKYLASRVYALQRDQAPEAYALLASATKERFHLDKLLDLDFQNLRRDPQYLRRIIR